jgi:hypothetical protein
MAPRTMSLTAMSLPPLGLKRCGFMHPVQRMLHP